MLPRICHTSVRDWSSCTRCRLSRTRRRVCLRRDSGERKRVHLLIIGEAPGKTEDVSGIPFSGYSGRILDQTLSRVKHPFSYVITNTVCCQPKDVVLVDSDDTERFYEGELDLKDLDPDDYEIINYNRDPTPQEIKACSPHIDELISDELPNGVVYLGNVAAKYMTRLPKLKLLHPAAIARKEYKLLTVKKQARKLELFIERFH